MLKTKVFLDHFSLSQSVFLQMWNLTFWFLSAERKIYKTLRRYMGVCPYPSSLSVTVASPLLLKVPAPSYLKITSQKSSSVDVFKILHPVWSKKYAVALSLGQLTWHFICAMIVWIMDSQKLCRNMRSHWSCYSVFTTNTVLTLICLRILWMPWEHMPLSRVSHVEHCSWALKVFLFLY